MKIFLVAMLLVGCISQASANTEVDIADRLYFGGGLGSNDLHGMDASGFQFFAGYPLKAKLGTGDLAIEAGYMDSGSFERTFNFSGIGAITSSTDATGLWGTMVGSWNVANNTSLIVRAGLDVGDDDGLMFGAGLGYALSKKLEIRGEYVVRDNIDSLQFNLVFR